MIQLWNNLLVSISFDSEKKRLPCAGHMINSAKAFLFGSHPSDFNKKPEEEKLETSRLKLWRERGPGNLHNTRASYIIASRRSNLNSDIVEVGETLLQNFLPFSLLFINLALQFYPILSQQSGCLIDVGMSARQTDQIIEISRQMDSESVVGLVGLLTSVVNRGLHGRIFKLRLSGFPALATNATHKSAAFIV